MHILLGQCRVAMPQPPGHAENGKYAISQCRAAAHGDERIHIGRAVQQFGKAARKILPVEQQNGQQQQKLGKGKNHAVFRAAKQVMQEGRRGQHMVHGNVHEHRQQNAGSDQALFCLLLRLFGQLSGALRPLDRPLCRGGHLGPELLHHLPQLAEGFVAHHAQDLAHVHLLRQAQHHPDVVLQLGGEGNVLLKHCADLLHDLPRFHLADGKEQLALGCKVLVDCGFSDPGPGGDLRDGGALDSPRAELSQRGVQDRLPAVLTDPRHGPSPPFPPSLPASWPASRPVSPQSAG